MYQSGFKQVALVSSPAKIIICGQHAVVYGQDALAMSIKQRCQALISQKKCEQLSQQKIIFHGCLEYQINLNEIDRNIQMQYKKYIQVKKMNQHCDEQYQKIKYKIGIFIQQTKLLFKSCYHHKIQLHSDIPIGKCLGSSSSFNTIFVTCLFIINFTPDQYQSIQFSQINRISKIFQKVQHGNPSGIDNYLATFGGLVLYNNTKNPPFTSIKDQNIIQKLQKQLRFRLIDSGITKNTEKAVKIVREHCNSDKDMIKEIGSFSKKIMEILSQNVEENQKNDWKEQLFEIVTKNHNYLRNLGVSIPEIEQIVSKNTMKGIKSAKLTGGGMGGYVLIVECSQKVTQAHLSTQIITEMDRNGLIIEYL